MDGFVVLTKGDNVPAVDTLRLWTTRAAMRMVLIRADMVTSVRCRER